MEQLPEKIVHIDILRINRNIDKKCKCKKRKFIIDTQNRQVYCNSCGAQVDPYEAMYDLAYRFEELNEQLDRHYQQRKEIANYKPHMIVFRELEREYRGKKMIPTCPHCNRGFYFEELKGWIHPELVEAEGGRRKWQRQALNGRVLVGILSPAVQRYLTGVAIVTLRRFHIDLS